MSHVQFSHVSFTYDSLNKPLIHDLSFSATLGWTGIVGPNGVGKTTLLSLATGALEPHDGHIIRPGVIRTCAQRTDAPPDDLTELLTFPDADAGRLVSMLAIGADWPYRWQTLSHGERKRAQVGVALWQTPELLVLDEPTNHLDRASRELLAESLETFRGIGLIVSHDRELLDRLCTQCLFLEAHMPHALRPGGVSDGLAERERERTEQARTFEAAQVAVRRIESEAVRRRDEASVVRQNRKRSKRSLSWKDSDAREKIDRARISGSDGQAGRLLNQLDGRTRQARARLDALDRPVRERVGVTVHGRRSQRDAIVRREAGDLQLPDGRLVTHPLLEIRGADRVSLEGPNGAGKTTLVRALLAAADDVRGEILWIPQELSASDANALAGRIRSLPSETLGRVISTVSRLGSDPEALLETAQPSPGEARKLMLALGLEDVPSLVVMDEPTNHLDLVSIQCLEQALNEFAGALLLVSHDTAFVHATARTRWSIDREGTLYVNEIRPE